MGGVVDGNPVNAAYTNPRFLDADGDDTALGKITLNDAGIGSGSSITNIQAEFNSVSFWIGRTINGSLTNLPAFTNNQGFGSDDIFTRLDSVSGKFHDTTGHSHTGNPGDAPQVLASTVASVPLKSYVQQGTNLLGVTGTQTNVTTELTGKVPSAIATVAGVVVNNPYNKILLQQATGANKGDAFVDGSGNIVYGRLTFSTPNWLLDYYVDIAGVETAYNFSVASDVAWFYQELFNPLNNPPVYSPLFFIPSDNATADVIDATTTLRGLVNTVSQSFGGAKTFVGDLIAQAKFIGDIVVNSTTTGTNAALPAPAKTIVELTNASLNSIATITGAVTPQFFVAINSTGANIKLKNYVGSGGIYTGTGNDIFFKKDSAALFVYIPALTAWFVVSGSGGGAEQIYPISLAANQTTFTTIPELSFALAEFSGLQIDYSIKESSTNKFRTGRFSVASDGVTANYFDEIFVQSSQIGQGAEGLELDATISGGNINIRFKNTDVVNGATMECFVQKFQT